MRVLGLAEKVYVSLTVVAQVVYTIVRCPDCRRFLMSVPGEVPHEVRRLMSEAEGSGRGRILACQRCARLCEIIEHAHAA